MNRDRQQKEQLVRKFEEIVPFLKTLQNFGWVIPKCDADPVYEIYPDSSGDSPPFKSFKINVKTGWHSEFVYRDERGVHRVREEIVPVMDEWSTLCYKDCCSRRIR